MDHHYFLSKRFFLVCSFLCLIIEIETSFLFLWPLNYSCAKPGNFKENSTTSKNEVDSGGHSIDFQAIQTNLADASIEDPITIARGLSMNYNYEDISHCLEHPIEYNDKKSGDLTIDMNNLETCRHGLQFDLIPHRDLSVVAQFQLACSRQWLKLLLHQSICVGSLIGIFITYWSSANRPFRSMLTLFRSDSIMRGSDIGERKKSLREITYWCSSQLIMILAAQYCSFQLESYKTEKLGTLFDGIDKLKDSYKMDYAFLLLSILLRSIMIMSNFTRIIRDWRCNSTRLSQSVIDHSSRAQQIFENHLYILLLAAISIAFEALYLPIVIRIFQHWFDLNEFLTNLSSLYVISVTLFEALILKFCLDRRLFESWKNLSRRWSYSEERDVELITDERNEQDEVYIEDLTTKASEDAADEYDNHTSRSSSKRWRHIEYNGFNIFNNEYPKVKVCEFCLIATEQTVNYSAKGTPKSRSATNINTTPMNHLHHNHQSLDEQASRQNNGNNDTIMMKMNDSSVVDFDPYRPTTVSHDSLINNENYNYNFNYNDDEKDNANNNNHDKNSNLTIMPSNSISSLSLATEQTMTQPPSSLVDTTHESSSLPLTYAPSSQHLPSSSYSSSPYSSSLAVSRQINERRPTRIFQTKHDLGRFYADLFKSSIVVQLNLLMLCLCFNCFLLKMIPNHDMIHSESIASKYARKISYHNTLTSAHYSKINGSSFELSHNDQIFTSENKNNHYRVKNHLNWSNQVTVNSIDEEKPEFTNYSLAKNESVSLRREHLFDYGNVNRAFIIFNSLYISNNPFEIVGATIELNQWPITLFVFLLHTSKLFNFESTYFKPRRLFTVVQFGSKLFVIEWTLIGKLACGSKL